MASAPNLFVDLDLHKLFSPRKSQNIQGTLIFTN